MNKREAKHKAYIISSNLIDQCINAGEWYLDDKLNSILSHEDFEKVNQALKDIAQELFERGNKHGTCKRRKD